MFQSDRRHPSQGRAAHSPRAVGRRRQGRLLLLPLAPPLTASLFPPPHNQFHRQKHRVGEAERTNDLLQLCHGG